MDSNILIKELKLFLKENKKFILFSTVIVVIIALLVQLALLWSGTSSDQTYEENSDLANPAEFKVYIENETTQEPFINSYLFEEIFEQPNNIEIVQKATGINFQETIETFSEMNPDSSYGDPLKPINANRHTSTQIMTIQFNIGKEKENLEVAKAYYELLISNELSIVEEKKIYSILEPQILSSEEKRSVSPTQTSSIVSFITSIVLALFGGTILGIVISLIRAMIDQKIRYAFTYSWDEKDVFLIYHNQKLNEREIMLSLLHPKKESRVILHDKSKNIQKFDEVKTIVSQYQKTNSTVGEIFIFENVSEINPLIDIEEFVIFIERNDTTKNWYKKQRNLLKNYPNSSVKIIQF